MEKTDAQKIYQTAMRLLAAREHAQRELEQKLTKRYPEHLQTISDILQTLQQDNLQSDQRFAESYVRYRVERGYGPLYIQQALRERGISPGVISLLLADPALDWPSLAESARQKHFGANALPTELRERAKQLRFLQQRGFFLSDIDRFP